MKGQTLGAFIKLVIFALVTVLATGLLAVVVSNRNFGATRTYKANFTDATALISGDDVRMAGVRVGTVKSIKVVGPNTAQVTFTAKPGIITQSTDVDLRYLNLVGQRYLSLVPQAGSSADQDAKQVIPTSRTSPALDLTALFNGFRPLFQGLTPQDVNSFATEIIETLQGEGGTVDDLVAKSASLTNTVADRDAVIGQVINNLLTVLNTVEKRNAGLNQTIVQLQRLVSGLAADRNTIAASLAPINDLAGNSSLLISQIRPFLPSDITSLSKVANALDTTKDCPGYFSNEDNEKQSAIPRFANNNCNGPNTLDAFLKREPDKLTKIIRTATYGQYFNFYLCQLELGGSSAGYLEKLGAKPSVQSNSPACAS